MYCSDLHDAVLIAGNSYKTPKTKQKYNCTCTQVYLLYLLCRLNIKNVLKLRFLAV